MRLPQASPDPKFVWCLWLASFVPCGFRHRVLLKCCFRWWMPVRAAYSKTCRTSYLCTDADDSLQDDTNFASASASKCVSQNYSLRASHALCHLAQSRIACQPVRAVTTAMEVQTKFTWAAAWALLCMRSGFKRALEVPACGGGARTGEAVPEPLCGQLASQPATARGLHGAVCGVICHTRLLPRANSSRLAGSFSTRVYSRRPWHKRVG